MRGWMLGLLIVGVVMGCSRAEAQVSYIGEWGTRGAGPGQFDYPSSIATAPDGSVYVGSGYYRVQKFSASGQFLLEWTLYDRIGNPAYTGRICVAPSGLVYVTCPEDPSVQMFSPEGVEIKRWGEWGTGFGGFIYPLGLAFGLGGELYVSDTSRFKILRFRDNGAFVSEFGAMGSGPGQSYGSAALAVSATGEVYATDSSNNRVQVSTPIGAYLRQWGASGSAAGRFSNPTGIALDADGDVYVGDYWNDRVQKFDALGNFQFAWGTRGAGQGEFLSVTDVAVGPDGTIYVVDQQNHRVQMFRESATPATPATWGTVKDRYR